MQTADCKRVMFYDHLVEVPNSEPPRFVVAMNRAGIPQELYDELTSHHTKVVDNVVSFTGGYQVTQFVEGIRYRLTILNRVLYVVRRLDF